MPMVGYHAARATQAHLCSGRDQPPDPSRTSVGDQLPTDSGLRCCGPRRILRALAGRSFHSVMRPVIMILVSFSSGPSRETSAVPGRRRSEAGVPNSAHSVRRAIILAAGRGARLGPLTTSAPKCLVKVNGDPIVFRALRALTVAGVSEVAIVVGYGAEQVKEQVGPHYAGLSVTYVPAPRFNATGNIYSLWEARDLCDQDILLIEGDMVFDSDVLTHLQEVPGNSMAVAPYRAAMSGTVVLRDEHRRVTSFVLKDDQLTGADYSDAFKTVNIYLLRANLLREHVLPELARQIESGNDQEYYEVVLRDLVAAGSIPDLVAVDVSASRWYEVDDHRDLELAEFRFLERSSQFDRLRQMHGSYWQYGAVDHVHPAHNPHFPPTELLNELRGDLNRIVSSYPTAQLELDRLVATWTNSEPECVVVGNGSSQLIRILGEHLVEHLALPVPTFNEYENVMHPTRLTRFPLEKDTFTLDIDSFVEAVRTSGSDVAVVVTPNIPTALTIKPKVILGLAEQLSECGCRLVVDESFVDFSRAGRAGSVESAIQSHSNLVVMKSMSKVFGVPGLRLGYLLTADLGFASEVRSHLPIWNVNGVGEAFLRRVGRYRAEFETSCALVYETCQLLYQDLRAMPGISPFAPDANFVFCATSVPGMTAVDLARRLYLEHGILVKDCSYNTLPSGDRFLQIGSRSYEENRVLVEALSSLL